MYDRKQCPPNTDMYVYRQSKQGPSQTGKVLYFTLNGIRVRTDALIQEIGGSYLLPLTPHRVCRSDTRVLLWSSLIMLTDTFLLMVLR